MKLHNYLLMDVNITITLMSRYNFIEVKDTIWQNTSL
jgi:hypothetical protein